MDFLACKHAPRSKRRFLVQQRDACADAFDRNAHVWSLIKSRIDSNVGRRDS